MKLFTFRVTFQPFNNGMEGAKEDLLDMFIVHSTAEIQVRHISFYDSAGAGHTFVGRPSVHLFVCYQNSEHDTLKRTNRF